jgi:hypothetical protein
LTLDLLNKAVSGKININAKTVEKKIRNVKLNHGTCPDVNMDLTSSFLSKLESLEEPLGVAMGIAIGVVSVSTTFSSITLETGLLMINNEKRITKLTTKIKNKPSVKENK